MRARRGVSGVSSIHACWTLRLPFLPIDDSADIFLATQDHFLRSPPEGREQVPIERTVLVLDTAQFYHIPDLYVTGAEGFRVPGLRALALGSIVSLGVNPGSYGSHHA